MTQDDILQLFEASGAVMSGHFVLSSGLHSDTYIQCAKLLMHPEKSEKVCQLLADKVRAALGEHAVDLVVSPAMGGVIVGYEMGRQLGVPAIFCERKEGEFVLRRGFDIEDGCRILLVEDVVTTGKSSLETYRCIEGFGGTVVAEASLVDRSHGEHQLPFPLISLLDISVNTYQPNQIPSEMASIPPVKPGSRWTKNA